MRRPEGFARPADSWDQPLGRGPGAGLPENQVSATAQSYSGKPPPPTEPPSFRNLAASVSTLRNLLRLDPGFAALLARIYSPKLLKTYSTVRDRTPCLETKGCEGDPRAEQAVSRLPASAFAVSVSRWCPPPGA